MIKKFPISKKLNQKFQTNYPHIINKIDIGVVLNTLLSQLPEPDEGVDKREYNKKCMNIVASTAIYYMSSLEKLAAGAKGSSEM